MDSNSITLIFGLAFALIVFVARIYYKRKDFNLIYTVFYVIAAYISGLMVYPAAYITYYSFTKGKTWFNEQILNYNQYLIIAGFILLVSAGWTLMELVNKSKNGDSKSSPQKEYDEISEILKKQGLKDKEIKEIIDAKKLDKFFENK